MKYLSRYQIGDSYCGVIEYAETRAEADRIGERCQRQHPDCQVVIYDRMAHRGRPNTWSANMTRRPV